MGVVARRLAAEPVGMSSTGSLSAPTARPSLLWLGPMEGRDDDAGTLSICFVLVLAVMGGEEEEEEANAAWSENGGVPAKG